MGRGQPEAALLVGTLPSIEKTLRISLLRISALAASSFHRSIPTGAYEIPKSPRDILLLAVNPATA